MVVVATRNAESRRQCSTRERGFHSPVSRWASRGFPLELAARRMLHALSTPGFCIVGRIFSCYLKHINSWFAVWILITGLRLGIGRRQGSEGRVRRPLRFPELGLFVSTLEIGCAFTWCLLLCVISPILTFPSPTIGQSMPECSRTANDILVIYIYNVIAPYSNLS